MIIVAGYCRVSTDRDDQANSFESQKRYFRDYILNHPDWMLHDIYADEGITGTSTKKRAQFNRMIQDAQEGKFNLIITKEVSRFSRNLLDTIAHTRQLKTLGVHVRFVNDGIDTSDPDAELRLSIMASIAQEESRRTSSRVVWGQTRQMERGVVFGPSMLGYDVKNGALSINPEGAKIVRLIFQKYALEQIGTSEIARYLINHGYQTYKGSFQWKPNGIIKILQNEKYVGDLVQKKTYTPDYLTHEKKTNRGQVPIVVIRNHHEPIINREIWNLAQSRLKKNNKHQNGSGGHSNRYVFSGKIKCGECGTSFAGRYKYLKDGRKIRRWSCGSVGCDVGKILREDDAMEMVKTALRNLPVDVNRVISDLVRMIQIGKNGCPEEQEHLQSEIKRMQQRKEKLMDCFFSEEISKEDMISMKEKYEKRLNELNHQLLQANHTQIDSSIVRSELKAILNGGLISEAFCKTILQNITVFKDRHMELRLYGLPYVFWFEEL